MVLDLDALLDELGHPEQPILRKAPLAVAMCQLRFPAILGFSEASVRPFQVELGTDYPDVQVQALQQVEFGLGGVTVTGESQHIYRFQAHGGAWVVTLGPESLSLQTQAYEGFRDFARRWYRVARACVEHLDLQHQHRIGLRYVNALAAPQEATREELEKVVRAELLGPIGAHTTTKRPVKSWQELRFAQDEGVLTLQHGYAEREPEHWTYVLDFDHYDEDGQAVDLENQVRALARFNHRMYELFKWAVAEDQFEKFEPEER